MIYIYDKLNLDILADASLKKKYHAFIDGLKKGTTCPGAEIKQLKGPKLYRAKLNDTARVLFISVNIKFSGYQKSPSQDNRKKAFVILEVLPNHAYNKSKFLKHRNIPEEWEEKCIQIDGIDDSEELYAEKDNSSDKVSMLGTKPILLNTKQKKIVGYDLPLVVGGSAGSGKTAVALQRLRKIKEKENIAGKVLYITRSKNLVDNSRKLFDDYYPEDNKASNTEIEFLSLDEFLKEEAKKININIEHKNPIDKNIFSLLLKDIKIANKTKFKFFDKYVSFGLDIKKRS